MAKLKTFICHCVGGANQALTVEIDAINVPQAVAFATARYPGYKKYYSSSQKR